MSAPAAPTAPAPPGSVRDLHLEPAAVAMAWLGTGRPHEPIAVTEVRLATGDLLVRVELATICGSDLHTVRGDRSAPTPLVLGHEYVGRVEALGPGVVLGVDGDPIRRGERIVWSIESHCGQCDRCRLGVTQKCREVRKYGHERLESRWQLSGGFASHVHVRAGTPVARVSENLPATVLAPLSCGTATAAAAIARAERSRDLEGAIVLITGAGLIGLTATAMASERGARVIVSDPDADRRSMARRFGAAAVVDAAAGAPAVEAVLSRLAGADAQVDVVIEASGARAAVASALEVVGIGGVVVLVGSVFAVEPVPFDPERVVRRLLTVTGVHNYAVADLRAAVEFMRPMIAARYPFAELVAPPVPLAELDAALERASRGDSVRVSIRTQC